MDQPFLSVVIPAYNEETRIANTLERVVSYLRSQEFTWEVIVADDGSTDATAQAVGQAVAQATGSADTAWGRVRLLPLRHGGKGWAVRHGMLAATGRYRLLSDADLSVPIEQVWRLLPPHSPEALDQATRDQEADVSVGSREAQGALRVGEPGRRHLMGRIFNGLVRRLAVPDLADTQCGFKCFTGAAAEELFPAQTMNGFSFDVELLFLARKKGLSVREVGVDWYYREQSKVRPVRDSLAMTFDLLKIRWRHRGRVKPTA